MVADSDQVRNCNKCLIALYVNLKYPLCDTVLENAEHRRFLLEHAVRHTCYNFDFDVGLNSNYSIC